MEALDKISGIIGYALVRAEDGSIDEVRGSSTAPIGDLTAFFSSATEVIRDSFTLGNIQSIWLTYGDHRLVIFPHEDKYLGVEVERDRAADDVINLVSASIKTSELPIVQLPRSVSSKLQQINLLVDEFGGADNKEHWLQLLNHGIGILGGELRPIVGIVGNNLVFKERPPDEKEDEYVQGLRSIIDYLVKKAVEEMGSTQARAKVQAVIERMK
jgi:hypothetical protein